MQTLIATFLNNTTKRYTPPHHLRKRVFHKNISDISDYKCRHLDKLFQVIRIKKIDLCLILERYLLSFRDAVEKAVLELLIGQKIRVRGK